MSTVASLVDKARQCRRLSRTVGDDRTIKALNALAEECEAEARALEASGAPADDQPIAPSRDPDAGERH